MSAHSAAHDHGHDAGSHASHGAHASDHPRTSAHGAASDSEAWANEEDEHDDGHHGEPPPPEPESPPWLPFLGGALFLLALLGLLLSQQAEPGASAEQDVSAEPGETEKATPSAAPRNPAPFGTGRLRPVLPRGGGERTPSGNP